MNRRTHSALARRPTINRMATASLLILALAGCGPATGQATPGTSATPSASGQQRLAVYKEFAACVRAHGAPNFPDPIINPQTDKVELPSGTAKPPPAAMNACKSISDRLPASENEHPPPSAADMAKLKSLARCMREHGLPDWPDPDADGLFTMPKRILDLGKKGMMTQIQACKQFYPASGRISFHAAGTNG